jgi:hypothetical protein
VARQISIVTRLKKIHRSVFFSFNKNKLYMSILITDFIINIVYHVYILWFFFLLFCLILKTILTAFFFRFFALWTLTLISFRKRLFALSNLIKTQQVKFNSLFNNLKNTLNGIFLLYFRFFSLWKFNFNVNFVTFPSFHFGKYW